MCGVLVYRISFRYCSENWRRVSASERNAKKRRQPTRCQMAHLWVPKFGTHLFSPVVYRQHPRKIFISFTAILSESQSKSADPVIQKYCIPEVVLTTSLNSFQFCLSFWRYSRETDAKLCGNFIWSVVYILYRQLGFTLG